MKKVIIVGAGPGGLAAGLLLSHKGYDVHIYEKDDRVGGRSQRLNLGDYTFDVGPTFLLYVDMLKQVFKTCGLALEDFITLKKIDPLYDLIYPDKLFKPTNDQNLMLEEIKRLFPGNEAGYLRFMKEQKELFERVSPIMMMPFNKRRYFLNKKVVKNVKYTNPRQTIYKSLKRYFNDEELIYGMSFQAKYLGMSAWKAPGLFTMLSYLEHAYGIYHVIGGLNQINEAFAKAIKTFGGSIHLSSPVKEIKVEKNSVQGISLSDDTFVEGDIVISNADFAYSMKNLFKPTVTKKIYSKPVEKLKYSVSTYMIYLGLDKLYDVAHHSIIFSDNYELSVKAMTEENKVYDSLSIYVHNPSLIDKTLAPKDHSALYILVPVPNNDALIEWDKEKHHFKEKVIDTIEQKTTIKNLRNHIVTEKIITPDDWENDFNVYKGAVFNLSHQLNQMLYRRPHNEIHAVKGLYLVGGGTHPGSGLPTIYQSAMITASLIEKRYK